jgi:hypothetical protein
MSGCSSGFCSYTCLMRYGRSHEEREQKLYPRTKINPTSTTLRNGLRQPLSAKSDAAPTGRAVEREHLRHEEERRRGRTAAGTHGVLRDQRSADVSREKLDEAARAADLRLELRSRKPHNKG